MEEVGRILRALLRSPKTKEGLAAAVADQGLSKAAVDGWLTLALDAGEVLTVSSAISPSRVTRHTRLYVLAGQEVQVIQPPSIFPAWMDPTIRFPEYLSRRVYRSGALEGIFDEQ